MISKCVLVAAFLATCAIASSLYPPVINGPLFAPAPNKSHNLIAGSRVSGDHFALQNYIYKSPSWMQVVSVEKTFNVSRYEKITQLQAIDQKTDGTGAYATIISGGPGKSNVTLRFKSQRGKGIEFAVVLYSRKQF